jgi:hypothetical protein
MIVMRYQYICNKCLWPVTERYWCNTCNARRFQDESRNWTSGNETIDKFIQKQQHIALNSDDAIRWFPFDEFRDVELIEGEFGTVLKASVTDWNIILNDKGIEDKERVEKAEEWITNAFRRAVYLKWFNSSNISEEFLQEVINLY